MTTKTFDEKRAMLMGGVNAPKGLKDTAESARVEVAFLPAERMVRTFKSHEKALLKNLGCVESDPKAQGLQ